MDEVRLHKTNIIQKTHRTKIRRFTLEYVGPHGGSVNIAAQIRKSLLSWYTKLGHKMLKEKWKIIN